MNIIIGASGQIGSAIAATLSRSGKKVRGIVRDENQVAGLTAAGASFAIADLHDLPALRRAFSGGKNLFVLTPEDGKVADVLGDTHEILHNIREAIEGSGIQKIVGLSSMGAHLDGDTGNLRMSYLLEHAFDDVPVIRLFIRPAYYYSNWLPYLDQVRETGVLRTFYPVDLAIPMVSPKEVAKFTADTIRLDYADQKIYEMEGPAWLTSNDVAAAFGDALEREVRAEQLPRDSWSAVLSAINFSPDGIKKFVAMTDTVIAGRARPEGREKVKGRETFAAFLREAVVEKVGVSYQL